MEMDNSTGDLASILVCIGCRKTPSELHEYVMSAREINETENPETPMTPERYVIQEEGTLNMINGHFTCTECYIKMGQPTSPRGWIAP